MHLGHYALAVLLAITPVTQAAECKLYGKGGPKWSMQVYAKDNCDSIIRRLNYTISGAHVNSCYHFNKKSAPSMALPRVNTASSGSRERSAKTRLSKQSPAGNTSSSPRSAGTFTSESYTTAISARTAGTFTADKRSWVHAILLSRSKKVTARQCAIRCRKRPTKPPRKRIFPLGSTTGS
jgi:hypothetical protein